MTCIVGLVDGGRVVMGGDSAGVGGYDLRVRADEKVFQTGPFLMGFTSSFRMGQLLRYDLVVPPQENDDDMSYLVRKFIPAVRQCLKEGGFAEREKEAESGGRFLLGYRGELYEIQEDYQVARHEAPYAACGCGASYALGALATSWEAAWTGGPLVRRRGEEHIDNALRVAERFSAGVRGPFVIRSLRGFDPSLVLDANPRV